MIERLFGDVPGWREACAEEAAAQVRPVWEYELTEPWFAELRAELLRAFRTEEIAGRWFFEQRTPAFSGKTAAEMVLAGEIARVTRLLANLNNGMFS